jgi:predicted SprT family Zn-dependent metalloprotease
MVAMTINRTVLDARLRRLAAVWAALWGCSTLWDDVHVSVNRRLTASLGRCLPRTRAIELSPRLFEDSRNLRREILCHELAHLAVFEKFGARVKPHGPEWRALMESAGFPPRGAIERRCGLPGAGRPRRRTRLVTYYEHRCPVCQFTRKARRPVPLWRCRACVSSGLDGVMLIRKISAGVDRQ